MLVVIVEWFTICKTHLSFKIKIALFQGHGSTEGQTSRNVNYKNQTSKQRKHDKKCLN